jgi:hypothetical protein
MKTVAVTYIPSKACDDKNHQVSHLKSYLPK